MSRRAQTLLARYAWPGNVRELENVGASLRQALTVTQPRPGESDMLPLKEVARQHVRKVLERAGGNRVKAAALLGISRATPYRLLPRA